MDSARFTLDRQDTFKITKNALIFLAPAILVIIASLQKEIPADAKYGVVILYLLNVATDILKKFLEGKPIKK